MTRRRKGGVKRRETDPASNQFPKCSPQPGTHKEIHRVTWIREEGRGEREIEVTRRRTGGIKRGESMLASNQFLMCSPQPGTPREVHGVTQRREAG